MPPWRRRLTALLMATPLKFFASVGQWARSLEGFDLRLHPKPTRVWVWLSWALPLGFVAAVWPALLALGSSAASAAAGAGAAGAGPGLLASLGPLVTYWAGPWLAFHAWMSVMSLIQHTGPHIPWAEEVRVWPRRWRAGRGAPAEGERWCCQCCRSSAGGGALKCTRRADATRA
jgi:hypothetical protein